MKLASRIGPPLAIGACVLLFAGALRFGNGPSRAVKAAPGESHQAEAGPFPRVAVGFHGTRLTLNRPPQRIASQALVIDHLLLAVTAPERVVAVSAFAHNPQYSFVAGLLRGMNVAVSSDPEAVLGQNPDLVMISQTARADFEQIVRAAGIPVFRMLAAFEDFDEIAEALRITGHITGEDAAAEREIGRMQRRIEQAKSRKPRGAKPLRVLPYSAHGKTFGRGSLFDHIIEELGAINVAAEQGVGPYGPISSEHVAAWNPDWIIASADAGNADDMLTRMRADIGVAVTTAGKQGNVLVVETRQHISMSHHAAGLMEAIAASLYREEP